MRLRCRVKTSSLVAFGVFGLCGVLSIILVVLSNVFRYVPDRVFEVRGVVLSAVLVLGVGVSLVLSLILCFVPRIYSWILSIRRPPGGWLLWVADCTCRKATLVLLNQMVADMRTEYFDALKEGREIKAQWIKMLYYIAIARALSVDRLLSVVLHHVLGAFRAGKS